MAQIMLDEANFSLIQNQSRLEQEQKEMATILSTFTEEAESQQDQNFFQDDNVISKKKKRISNYSNTKVKARNLLTNVSHRRFKQSDFNSASFIIDILSFLVQNFNPINLDIKLDIDKERDMVKLLWEECIPHDFIRYIYKAENYTSISNPKLTYQKANEIFKNFINANSNRINYQSVKKYKIEEKFKLIHYLFTILKNLQLNKQF